MCELAFMLLCQFFQLFIWFLDKNTQYHSSTARILLQMVQPGATKLHYLQKEKWIIRVCVSYLLIYLFLTILLIWFNSGKICMCVFVNAT